MRFPIHVLLLAVTALGCEGSFNPQGPYQHQLVVYSVLSTLSNSQLAQLTTTYDPPGSNPYGNTDSHQATAGVTISDGSTVFVPRDTTIPRADTGRYTDSIRALVFSPLSLVRGATYTLTVNSAEFGTLSASTTMPGNGVPEIEQEGKSVLRDPVANRGNIVVYGTLSNATEGHVLRLYLEYAIFSSDTVVKTEEVPLQSYNYGDCTTFDSEFPSLHRRTVSFGREMMTYANVTYRRTILRIKYLNAGKTVLFRRAILVMTQADRHLYRYYSIANGFRDEFSIRVDLPNYTNIGGGLGVFGSFATDSLFYSLQTEFPTLVSCE